MPQLTTARFMHQATIIRANDSWTLFVAGGKTQDGWLNTTESLDLTPYFKRGLTTTTKDGMVATLTSNWVTRAPMHDARANFAMTAFKDTIWVIGGIAGRDAKEAHRPMMSSVCEKYSISKDKWEQVEIANLNSLAAFAWTPVNEPTQIMILGGSNGSIMADELLCVDLTKAEAKNND